MLALKDTLGEIEERGEDAFSVTIPRCEALKGFFGNEFGDELLGYGDVYAEVDKALDGR